MGSITEGFKSMSDSILEATKAKIKRDTEKAEKASKLANVENMSTKQVELLLNNPSVGDEIKRFAKEQYQIGAEFGDPDMAEAHFKSVSSFVSDVMKKQVAESKTKEEQIGMWQNILTSASKVKDFSTIGTAQSALDSLTGRIKTEAASVGQPSATPTSQPISSQSTSSQSPSNSLQSDIDSFTPQYDAAGDETLASQIKGEEFKERSKVQIEQAQKIASANRISENNVVLVSTAMNGLAKTWADAFEEGGVGSLLNAKKSDLFLAIGGKQGDKFKSTGALKGRITEVITKMMPLLTQQGEKEGSVRLVSTVFDKLIETVPGKVEGSETGYTQMASTIENMIGFASAIKNAGITNEQVEGMSEKELSALGEKIADLSTSIEKSPEDLDSMDEFIGKSLEPMWKTIKFNSPKEAEKSDLPHGTFISIGGKKARLNRARVSNE